MRETAWLIEMLHNDAPVPRWWHPRDGWVWDANRAMRFAREIDAADFAQCMYGAGGKPTEHVWCNPAPSPETEA